MQHDGNDWASAGAPVDLITGSTQDEGVGMKTETISCDSGDWNGWSETVGFVIRRITRREIKDSSKSNQETKKDVGGFFLVEFDILDGRKGYSTTGFWAIDAERHEPIAEPTCTPMGLSEALSAERIQTDLSVTEAKEHLLRFLRPLLKDWA
jgi:hypothetical protein